MQSFTRKDNLQRHMRKIHNAEADFDVSEAVGGPKAKKTSLAELCQDSVGPNDTFSRKLQSREHEDHLSRPCSPLQAEDTTGEGERGFHGVVERCYVGSNTDTVSSPELEGAEDHLSKTYSDDHSVEPTYESDPDSDSDPDSGISSRFTRLDCEDQEEESEMTQKRLERRLSKRVDTGIFKRTHSQRADGDTAATDIDDTDERSGDASIRRLRRRVLSPVGGPIDWEYETSCPEPDPFPVLGSPKQVPRQVPEVQRSLKVSKKSYYTPTYRDSKAIERPVLLINVESQYGRLDKTRKEFVGTGGEVEHASFETLCLLWPHLRRLLDEDAMTHERVLKRNFFSDREENSVNLQGTAQRAYDYAIENVFATVLYGLGVMHDRPNVPVNCRTFISRTRRLWCSDQLKFAEAIPFCRYLLMESAKRTKAKTALSAYLLMESAKSSPVRAPLSVQFDGLDSIWDAHSPHSLGLSGTTCRILPTSNLHGLTAMEIMRMSLRTIGLNVRTVHIVPKAPPESDGDTTISDRSSKRTGALVTKAAEELHIRACNSGSKSTIGRSQVDSQDVAAIERESAVVMTQPLQCSKVDADMDIALPTIEPDAGRSSNECEAEMMELPQLNFESSSDTPESAGQMHAHRNSRTRGKKHRYTRWKRHQRSGILASDSDSANDSDISMAYDSTDSEDSDYTSHGNASHDSGIFRYHSPVSGTSGSSSTQHSKDLSHRSSIGPGGGGAEGCSKSLEVGNGSGLHGLGSSEEGVQIVGCPQQKRGSRVKVIPCPITGCPGKECDISRLMYAQDPQTPARGYDSALICVIQTQTPKCRTQYIHLPTLLAQVR
jgi:hypothetical protein